MAVTTSLLLGTWHARDQFVELFLRRPNAHKLRNLFLCLRLLGRYCNTFSMLRGGLPNVVYLCNGRWTDPVRSERHRCRESERERKKRQLSLTLLVLCVGTALLLICLGAMRRFRSDPSRTPRARRRWS